MLEPTLIERIRAIFLHPAARVTVAEAAGLLGWSGAVMREAVENGEIAVIRTCSGERIERAEVWGKALERWPVVVVEEALGREARRALPAAVRTRRISVKLPRYQVAALEFVAEQERLTVETLLARELEDFVSAHAEELAAGIAGFAQGLRFPFGETS
jgi:hypothetical protein